MADILVIAIIAVILILAIRYIVKSKKSGAKCIGCPDGCSCSAKSGGTGCSCHSEK